MPAIPGGYDKNSLNNEAGNFRQGIGEIGGLSRENLVGTLATVVSSDVCLDGVKSNKEFWRRYSELSWSNFKSSTEKVFGTQNRPNGIFGKGRVPRLLAGERECHLWRKRLI